MKRSALLIALLIALFTYLISTPVSLSAQEKEIILEKIVVTATRDAQEIRKIPANVTVITREEIEKSNFQMVIDIVRNEVGVVVRDIYGTGKKASVDIRGLGETGPLNTLVLVDGRRVNEIDLSGVDWTQIPLNQVERIEVVRGSGSVLYGDNAVGGVINIITKKPEKPFSVSAEGVFGSYYSHKESGSINGKWGPFSVILNAGYQGTDGYRTNGFLKAKDLGGRILYDLNENIQLNFSGNLHWDDTGLPGGLNKPLYKQDRRTTLDPDNHAETDDGYGALGFNVKLSDWGRIETDLSYRHRNGKNFLDFPSSFYTYRDERKLETWGLTPKYILETPLLNLLNKLTLGLDFYRSDAEVKSREVFFGFPSSNRSDALKRSTGIYLHDELSFFKNAVLTMGLRHEWVTYDLFMLTPGLKDRIEDHEPAWNIGFNYLFGKRSSAFFSVKRSFRFPVSDEMIALDLTTFQLKINSTIKPQTGYHYEAGVRHAFTDQIDLNLTFFWMDLRNEIFFNPQTFNNENFPKTRRQGMELGLKFKPFQWLSVWGNYDYIKPELREAPFSGNDIPMVARHKGAIGADLAFGDGFMFNVAANLIGSRYFISDWSNRVDRLDGYYTLDMKLSYSWKGLKVFAGINNLFDRKYAEYAVTNAAGTARLYYPSPERNFFGGISYTF